MNPLKSSVHYHAQTERCVKFLLLRAPTSNSIAYFLSAVNSCHNCGLICEDVTIIAEFPNIRYHKGGDWYHIFVDTLCDTIHVLLIAYQCMRDSVQKIGGSRRPQHGLSCGEAKRIAFRLWMHTDSIN